MSDTKLKLDSRQSVLQVLTPLMRQCSFRKRRLRWCRTRERIIQVFDVQHSSWSDIYYFNLGIYDGRLGDADFPAIYECHVQIRTTSLALPSGCDDVALDFTKDVVDREHQLHHIAQTGILWLNQVASVKGMSRYLRSSASRYHLVAHALRELYAAA